MSDQLPILDIVPDIKDKLSLHNTLILQAPPGAGKSTVLPLQLLEEPWLQGKKIIMLEPRRLAARSVATRMASLLDETVGQTVGYRVRFENKISKDTRIEVVTEGILTRMLQSDNLLEGAGLVIFDEFHERSLHADLSLALCREVQQVLREDLKILVMSATLDGEKLSELLGNAPVLTSLGRQHPVTLRYIQAETHIPLPVQTAKAIRKALQEEEGDILTFLPGAGEINRTQEILEMENISASIHPLYGDLSQQKQQEALLPHPYGQRKVILATSIAETSLTIEGIKIVIDSGYARAARFDPRTGLTRLETIRVTKDAADQRAGRAGRLGPGICYRLWNEGSHQHLLPQRTPEILEADLAPVLLELLQWGARDVRTMTWLTPPPAGAVSQALELLVQLDAVKEEKITERGKQMLRLPTHPRIAHLLLEGKEYGLANLAADVAAILEERDPLPRESGADLTARIEALRKWRSKGAVQADRNILERIERLAAAWRKHFNIPSDNTAPVHGQVGKLLAAAYPERIAKQRDHDTMSYRMANGRIVRLKEHDLLFREKWLAVAHLDAGSGEGKVYLASPLDPEDVAHLAAPVQVISWDMQKGILVARSERRIGDVIIESHPLEKIPEEEKIKVICEAIRKEEHKNLNWSEETSGWQARVLSLRNWRPEENWPDVSTTQLLATAEDWLSPYLGKVRKREDLKKLELPQILTSLLPWELHAKLETLAPDKIKVPSGSMITLQYHSDGSTPVLAVRLQEMFGLLDTPAINEGRTKVLLHLLSPGYKPVQVTQDLKSFWKNTYPEVRKQLRVRYQKHHWPEDPWTAEAVRGAKKRNPNP